jgi:uncharacterized glyoxalase superfamily protein PhnB
MSTLTVSPTAPAAVSKVTMYPIIGYRDLGAGIDWLCRVFSFEPLEVMRNDDGSYAHVELRLGNGMIMPTSLDKQGDADSHNPWDKPIGTQGLYVALDGLDAHYARATAEGAEILRPLGDTPYGSREYTARDLEGNLWSFGSYRPATG